MYVIRRYHCHVMYDMYVMQCPLLIDLGNQAGCGLSYRCNGNLRAVNDGSRTTGHASFTAGSLVRMILDFEAQHVELYVSGVSQGELIICFIPYPYRHQQFCESLQ
jgi:hypothetical protein